MADYSNKLEVAAKLEQIPGHPLHTFARENKALEELLNKAKQLLNDKNDEEIMKLLSKIREVAIHYAKKGDLLYPHLNAKYEIVGPSNVIWTTDDEIRDELASLVKAESLDQEWYDRVRSVIKAAEDMIYKDEHVVFPNCAVNFTEEEWIGIYQDSKDYPVCLGVEPEVWEPGEKEIHTEMALRDGEVIMPGGHMTVEQLRALLNTIPLEITFIDDQNINRYFNEGPKVFKRPSMAIDREVFSCHPPKIEVQVRKIIEEFRNGIRDTVPLWMEKNGEIMSVTYMAVRNQNGEYLGTVELVQNMEHAKSYFEKKKK